MDRTIKSVEQLNGWFIYSQRQISLIIATDIIRRKKIMKSYFGKFINKYFSNVAYFYERLGYRIFVRMSLSISVGVLDGFGLAMFLPLLQMTDGSSVVNPDGLGKMEFFLNGIVGMGVEFTLVSILTVMSIFFILKGVAHYINGIYNINLRQYFIRKLRIKLSEALSRMSYKSFLQADAGRIQNTMAGEVGRVSSAYENYFNAIQQMVLVVVYMGFALLVDLRFALLIFLGGLLTNFIYKNLYKATKVASVRVTLNTHIFQGLILQFVANFKYLKATRYIREYNQKLIKNIFDIEENNRKIGYLTTIVDALREPILILVVSAVILVQVNVFEGSLATILISLLFFYRALASLILVQTHYNDFLAVSGSLQNMTDFEEELKGSQEKLGEKKIKKFSQFIELRDAGFSYSGKTVLQDINLRIVKNQTVAFVGESGSGKTTLINILCGLISTSSGKMKVDGVDVQELNMESLGRRIGYITQEPVIFNDTIFNNVSFWADPTPENRARFEKAMHQALIADFLEELPEKENTVLGNNGVNLSGGQKQRIAIARELYKDVDILVLDEATSALDSETEEQIQKGLDELQGRFTILMVAHRLSTIKNADRILIIKRGKIVAEGSFGELLLNSSQFQKMVELQEV